MKVDVPEPMNRMFIERESKEDAVKKSFERRKRVTENVPPTNPCQQNTCTNVKLYVSNLYKLVYRKCSN